MECLESCSGLTKFVVVESSAVDIAKSAKKQGSKKCTCHNMECLKAHITQLGSVDPPHANASQKLQDLYKKSLQLHKTVLGQLSVMTRLTQLDMGRSKILSIFSSDEEGLYSSEEDDKDKDDRDSRQYGDRPQSQRIGRGRCTAGECTSSNHISFFMAKFLPSHIPCFLSLIKRPPEQTMRRQ